MNLLQKNIILVDRLLEDQSIVRSGDGIDLSRIVTLDPLALFSKVDWTRFEEDVAVINTVYSHLFEEVVIGRKKLQCFWPLAEQLGSDWFELQTLCTLNNYELEVYKSTGFDDENYGFGEKVLQAWKKFVYFLIDSLIEDTKLNEELEEIATLTSGEDSIVLFRLVDTHYRSYTFVRDKALGQANEIGGGLELESRSHLTKFESFEAMLDHLLDRRDLSRYESRFLDPHLEKVFFGLLSRRTDAINLIGSWQLMYSLN